MIITMKKDATTSDIEHVMKDSYKNNKNNSNSSNQTPRYLKKNVRFLL